MARRKIKIEVVPGAFITYSFSIRQTGNFELPKGGGAVNLGHLTAVDIATEMQKASAAHLRVMRKRVGYTGRLRRAILSSENVSIQPRSILMFNVRFLNHQVPYWRAIDQGLSRGFVGRKVPGFFSTGGDPSRLRRGTRKLGQKFNYTGVPGLKIGMLVARETMRKDGVMGRPWMTIQHAIQPQGYVAAAAAAFTNRDASKVAQSIIRTWKLRARR